MASDSFPDAVFQRLWEQLAVSSRLITGRAREDEILEEAAHLCSPALRVSSKLLVLAVQAAAEEEAEENDASSMSTTL